MEAIGLQPGAPGGGWLQPLDIVGITSHNPEMASVTKGGRQGRPQVQGRLHRVLGRGHARSAAGQRGDRVRRLRHRGPRVPVGRLQGRGPQGQGPAHDEQRSRGRSRSSSRARRGSTTGAGPTSTRSRPGKGAAGAIIIHTEPSAGYKWQVVTSSWSGENFALPVGRTAGDPGPGLGHGRGLAAHRARWAARTSTRCARPRRSATSSRCPSA